MQNAILAIRAMFRAGAAIAIAVMFWPIAAAMADDFEYGTNRPGSDYRPPIDLQFKNNSLLTFEMECRGLCSKESLCKAWTMVKPGVQGPTAKCWLKNAVPAAQNNNCCISGLRTFNSCVIVGIARTDIAESDCVEAQTTGCIRHLLDDSQYANCLQAQKGAVVHHAPGILQTGSSATNNKIVAFARSKLGTCVNSAFGSDCECTRLVEAALADAGAWTGSNYVWGEEVVNVVPGNIIQFWDTHFTGPNLTWGVATAPGSHHTAIVEKANGTLVTLIHQNDGEKITHRGVTNGGFELDLAWPHTGRYVVYRARAN